MKITIKILKWVLISLGSLLLFITVLNIVPFTLFKIEKNNKFIKNGEYPLVIPHGGAKYLAPENTYYAYDMLIDELHADVLEIDLTYTKDGYLISHHDLQLTMSSESDLNKKLIRTLTYQEIKDGYYNDNYFLAREFTLPEDLGGTQPFLNSDIEDLSNMVPADLEDIFIKNKDNVLYILEIKDSPTSKGFDANIHDYKLPAQHLIDLVKKYNLEENVVLASFSDDVTSYFKLNAPDMLINGSEKEVTNFAIFSAFHIDFFYQPKAEVLILPIPEDMEIKGNTAKLLDLIPGIFRDSIALKVDGVYRANLMHQQIINDAHKKGMAVLYWTVNDEDQMRLLIENGADGIITDRPDLLIKVINELKNK